MRKTKYDQPMKNKMGTMKDGVEFVIQHSKMSDAQAMVLRADAETRHVVNLLMHLTNPRELYDTPERINMVSNGLVDVFTSHGCTNKETFAAVAEMFFIMATIKPDIRTYQQINTAMEDILDRLGYMIRATLKAAKPDLEAKLAEINDPMAEHTNIFKKATEDGEQPRRLEG